MEGQPSGRTDARRAPAHPLLLEIDTWPWLSGLSAAAGRELDLATVPPHVWDQVADGGYDLVWLMGVWQRSPAGVAVARADTGLVASFRAALPDLADADVVGSPYCVRDYVVDDRFGGPAALAVARAELRARGVGLVLDFVPNHVAPDHPWVSSHPERFVLGSAEDLAQDPSGYVELAGHVVALGRDPYFPPWPDVVQLDAFSPDLRAAVVGTLRDIAGQCDGVRCDMAMLVMDDVFAGTWGDRVGEPPPRPYWPEVVEAVRETHPGFLFLAEAYWDREAALQDQGFDHCYDKRLYDRLVDGAPAADVAAHLAAEPAYQRRLVRFLENHDEPRAAAVLDPARHRAAAVATLTQCGLRLVHDGQTVGRRTRLPVFLGRYPDEPVDAELETFYRRLLGALLDPTFRTGSWQLCRTTGWEGNPAAAQVVSWCWSGDARWLVVVNLGEVPAAAHVATPWPDLRSARLLLHDPTQAAAYERSGDDLVDGLYVELPAWGWHLFRVSAALEEDTDDTPAHR
ncbi:hypothetical protein [Nocardioides sp.]|uniref:hypothetical protein n=1 Tax=Nocardioides sp. TaxID=35761 RepID=UPI003783D4B4